MVKTRFLFQRVYYNLKSYDTMKPIMFLNPHMGKYVRKVVICLTDTKEGGMRKRFDSYNWSCLKYVKELKIVFDRCDWENYGAQRLVKLVKVEPLEAVVVVEGMEDEDDKVKEIGDTIKGLINLRVEE
jgi:hypothetical protein